MLILNKKRREVLARKICRFFILDTDLIPYRDFRLKNAKVVAPGKKER
jgi:hypothetical protein